MICYEEFDTDNRFPVVLPCGHTYVCSECANRIDRCMECRTSVFETPVVPPYARQLMSDPSLGRSGSTTRSRGSLHSRYRRRPGSSPATNEGGVKPEIIPKKRLPLPKNVVLMSLMHATELASKNADDHHNLIQMNISEDDDEETKITRITEVAAGACGTYAVAAKTGLEIVKEIRKASPTKKKRLLNIQGEKSKSLDWETRVDKIIVQNSGKRLSMEDDEDYRLEHLRLKFGDRVQVVTIIDGWAKLARGYGFVQCERSSDLVKVGGALDKACNLEAMILSRSLRRNELRHEQTRVERDALVIMKEMQKTLNKEEDLTVIAAEAFSKADPPTKRRECRDEEDHFKLLRSSSTKSEDGLTKSTAAYVVRNEIRDESSGLLCFPKGLLSFFTCNNGGSMDSTNTNNRLFPSTSRIGQSDMVAGAQKWRLNQGKEAVSGTDFQTGISGHHAMQSNEAHPHIFLEKELKEVGSGLPKMSQHSGLTVTRRKPSLSFG